MLLILIPLSFQDHWLGTLRGHLRVQLFRSLQSFFHAAANIFRPHVLLELSLLHQSRRLFARTAQDESSAGAVHHVRKFFQGLQSGGVDCGHIPQAQNHDRRQFLDLREDFFNLVGRTEKKWPVNAENRHLGWDFLVLQDVRVAFANIFLRHLGDSRCRGNLADEHQRSEYHPHLYSNRQIREHGQ